jgi:hypothetical protein
VFEGIETKRAATVYAGALERAERGDNPVKKTLNIYTDDYELGNMPPPIRCEEITDAHWSDESEDYPLDKFSKDVEGLRYEVIHIYNATRQEVLNHLRERGVRVFEEVKEKTDPVRIVEIYKYCMDESFGEVNALEQICGEIYANTSDTTVAREIGTEVFNLLKAGALGVQEEMRVRYEFVFGDSRRTTTA